MPMRLRLTKTVVDGLEARRGELVVYDDDVKRLALRVYPTGRKVYLLRLRVDGRQRWYTIGAHGDPWTVETAREEAARVLGQGATIAKLRETGAAPPSLLHPVEARERGRRIPTLADFARRYLEEHAGPHKAPATVTADRSLLGLLVDDEGEPVKGEDGKPAPPRAGTILAELGRLRVDRVTRAEVTAYHLSLRDTPTRANRALALLSHMFTMAEKWGVRADGSNPCRHVERFAETRRERFLSAAELARLGKALAAADKAGDLTPFGLASIRLLIFTGARAGEVLCLRWKHGPGCAGHVELARGTAELHASKTGAKVLLLPPPALKVLKALPRLAGNPHVIAGRSRGEALTIFGLEGVWQEVRKAAKLEDVRLHDLRHSFASVAAGSGQSLPVIGALLGHSQAQTTKRYAHLADDPLRAASKAVAGRLAAAMRTGPAKDNLRAIRGGRR
jgi:integrase